MAVFEKWFTQDLTDEKDKRQVRHCEDVVFSGDNLSNLVGVYLFEDGEPYSGGGTVSANVILSNGTTVPLTGTISGNAVSVTLTESCFVAPGNIAVFIRLTSGDVKTVVLSAIFGCVASETGTIVDPGTIIPSVSALIDAIDAAIDSLPPDYSDLLGAIAPTFSASTAYTAGQFVWYDGVLYRFTSSHSAGSWVGTDAASAVITTDLNPTVNGTTLIL